MQQCGRALTQATPPTATDWVKNSGPVKRSITFVIEDTLWLDQTRSCVSWMDSGLKLDLCVRTCPSNLVPKAFPYSYALGRPHPPHIEKPWERGCLSFLV